MCNNGTIHHTAHTYVTTDCLPIVREIVLNLVRDWLYSVKQVLGRIQVHYLLPSLSSLDNHSGSV